MRERLLAWTWPVPAPFDLSAVLSRHSCWEGTSGPALRQAANQHGTRPVTLMGCNTLGNATETRQVCFAHATAASADTATCFGQHWHGKHSKHSHRDKRLPSSPAWDTLTSPPSLLPSIVKDNTKICHLFFKMALFQRGLFPPCFSEAN